MSKEHFIKKLLNGETVWANDLELTQIKEYFKNADKDELIIKWDDSYWKCYLL